MKTSLLYILTKKLKRSILLFSACALFMAAHAQTGMRLTGFGKYDYTGGIWYNVDSLKQTWLGNFGGDEDHPNGDTWNLTYREAINSNYSTINYASRLTNTYNTDNQLISSLRLEWDGSAFQNSSRSTNTYDGQGRKVQILEEGWVAGAWVNSSMRIDSFNSEGQVIKEELRQWTTATNTWDPLQIVIYEYNAAGKSTLYQSIYWSGTGWINQDKIEKVYDGDNYLLTQTSYTGSGSNWLNGSRFSYQYDLNHNQTIYSYFTWNTGTSAWKNLRRDLFTYNPNNLKTEWTEQTWSTTWDNAFRYTFTYNSADLVETSTRQNWSGTWDNYRKYTDLYNANGFLVEDKTQNWDAGAWVDASKTTHTRNSFDQKILTRQETYAAGAWSTKNEKYYYYEAYSPVTGVEQIVAAGGIKVYPNPFVQNCMLGFESELAGQNQIQIWDMSGRLIKETGAYFPAGTNQWLFDGMDSRGNEVTKGMYLVKIESNGKSAVQKIAKL